MEGSSFEKTPAFRTDETIPGEGKAHDVEAKILKEIEASGNDFLRKQKALSTTLSVYKKENLVADNRIAFMELEKEEAEKRLKKLAETHRIDISKYYVQ